MLKLFRGTDVAVYRLAAPSDEVEFLVFGKAKDIEGLASVLAPSFEEDLVVERLDAERVPGHDNGYEGVLPEDEGPVPACYREGDPVTYLDEHDVRQDGTYITVDVEEPTHAFVKPAEGIPLTRVRVVRIEHA